MDVGGLPSRGVQQPFGLLLLFRSSSSMRVQSGASRRAIHRRLTEMKGSWQRTLAQDLSIQVPGLPRTSMRPDEGGAGYGFRLASDLSTAPVGDLEQRFDLGDQALDDPRSTCQEVLSGNFFGRPTNPPHPAPRPYVFEPDVAHLRGGQP